jgi:hypothetical protein
MKDTMPIQLAVDNNIVQNHCNIVWKISRKNVLREAYLDKHLRFLGCLRTSQYANFEAVMPSTGGGQQYCAKSLQHCMENFKEKCTPRSIFR